MIPKVNTDGQWGKIMITVMGICKYHGAMNKQTKINLIIHAIPENFITVKTLTYTQDFLVRSKMVLVP